MPARLLLLCLLFRSSWLTVEGGRGRRRHSAASSGRTGRRGRVGRRGWWRSRATARHSGSSSAAFWGCRTLLLGSCLKPVAGASSGPTRVLLRPPCEPRGRWQARPNSHEVAPGPGPRSRAVPKRRPARGRLSLAACCRTGAPDYGARRGRGRRRCQSWSRSASSSAPKPASGPSMRNIWMVRSGSTWTWLRNASTLRPVSSSIIWL